MTDGNPESWNHLWGGAADSVRTLYTAGRATTLGQFWLRSYFEDLWGLGRLCSGSRCIELGAGRGTTSMYLSAHGCAVTLVDLSLEGLALARRNFAAAGLCEPQVLVADARTTGLPGALFDCVHGIGVLEHFEKPQPLLSESFRLLRSGGLYFNVIVPRIGPARRWLTTSLFTPWVLPVLLVRIVRFRLRHGRGDDSGIVRTSHDNSQWEQWALEAGASAATCIDYNPYHPLSAAWLERNVAMPVYAVHRRRRRGPLRLRTGHSTALAQLLVATK